MRIGFSNINPYYEKFKKDENNKLPEDFFLDDKKNNKGKLEVRREQGYIKQYIIKPNGEKILISEVKETDETDKQKSAKSTLNNTDTTTDNNKTSNTKELMQMLNHSVGAGLPLQLNYKYTKK